MKVMQLHKQRGFSLIEAMVAFLVVSVGMLGIASLQLLSLKAGHTAVLRTVAVIKVEEILERMRANPTALVDYAVDTGGMGLNNGCNAATATICAPKALAEDDIFYWKQSFAEAMPNTNTEAAITHKPAVPLVQPLAEITVTVSWDERKTESAALTPMSYTASLMMATR